MRLAEINVSETIALDYTIQLMRDMENESINNFSFKMFVNTHFANMKHDLKMLFYCLWFYVHNNFVYQDDQADEVLISPKFMPLIKKGDCDDYSLFIKSVLSCLGIKANYILCGKDYSGFTHIAVVTCCGIILDGVSNQFNYLSDEYINRKII